MFGWAAVAALLALGASLLGGCSCASETAGPEDGGVPDAVIDAVVEDVVLAVDAVVQDVSVPPADGGPDAHGDAAYDAGEDASEDAAIDAVDGCADCVADGVCATASCVDGMCVRGAAADYVACGDGDAGDVQWCVAGECVIAECGDGIVAVGEACDDGNDVDTDACGNDCQWRLHTVHTGMVTGVTLRDRNALAIDGNGTLMTVWTELAHVEGPTEVRGRRMLASGAVVDDTWLVFNSSSTSSPSPNVAGHPAGGFGVAFVMGAEVYVRTVSAGGQIGTLRKFSDTLVTTEATIAPLGTGYVVVWTRSGTLYAQRVTAAGTLVGSRITVNTTPAHSTNNLHGLSAVASDGDDWIVVWERVTTLPGIPPRTVVARRFSEGSALDANEQRYSAGDTSALHPAVIARPDGWLVAYTDYSHDSGGEVSTRFVTRQGTLMDPVLESGIDGATSVVETFPVLCGYGDDDHFIAWHLRHQRNNARAAFGSQRLGVTPVPELALLNTQIGLSGWIDGLSCASGPQGVWVTWSAGSNIRALHLPLPVEAP